LLLPQDNNKLLLQLKAQYMVHRKLNKVDFQIYVAPFGAQRERQQGIYANPSVYLFKVSSVY
jgi:hypothetical protein